jgi:hypothetical protein
MWWTFLQHLEEHAVDLLQHLQVHQKTLPGR